MFICFMRAQTKSTVLLGQDFVHTFGYIHIYMDIENQYTLVNYSMYSSPVIPPLSQTFIWLIHMDIIDFVRARWR